MRVETRQNRNTVPFDFSSIACIGKPIWNHLKIKLKMNLYSNGYSSTVILTQRLKGLHHPAAAIKVLLFTKRGLLCPSTKHCCVCEDYALKNT